MNPKGRMAGPLRSYLATFCLVVLIAGTSILGATVPCAAFDKQLEKEVKRIRDLNTVGRAADAERASRADLRNAERRYGAESAEVAEILDELAVALRRGGKAGDSEALEVCQRAVRIKEQTYGESDARTATSLHNLGLLWYSRKEYVRADSTLHAALEIRKARLGSNDPDIAKSLLALGSVEHARGRYDEALRLLERSVAINDAALKGNDPEKAYGLIALSSIRYSLGEYASAIPLLDKAIDLWQRSSAPNRAVLANCFHNRGAILSEIGDYERASEDLRRALRLREEALGHDNTLVASTLTALASASGAAGNRSEEKESLERALAIFERAQPGGADAGWVRAKLGWVYLEENDLTRADGAFRRSLVEQESALGQEHPDLWICLRGLAMTARRRGDWTEAQQYYDRAIRLLRATSGLSHPDLGKTLTEYAAFQLAKGDSSQAFETALEAASVNREHLRLTARGVAERQALIYTTTLDTGLDQAMAILAGSIGRSSPELVRRGWDALIRSRALVLDEVAERARMVGGAGEVVEAAKRLESARSRLANLLVRGKSAESQEESSTLLNRAQDEVGRAESELASLSQSFRQEQDHASFGWDDVRSALPQGSALVSYVSYGQGRDESIAAFVTRADGTPAFVPLGSAERIDSQVARWREAAGKPPLGEGLESKKAETACNDEGRTLRSLVWDPIEADLVVSGFVFIVPDGSLNLINFAALPGRGAGYLIEGDRVIHYLSAERDLVAAQGVPSRGAGLLAIGGVSFDSPEDQPRAESVSQSRTRGVKGQSASLAQMKPECSDFDSVRFEPLPETSQEIKEVVDAWDRAGSVTVLTGTQAGERAVKALMPGKRVVHFATHGFFLSSRCRTAASGGEDARGIGGYSTAASEHVVQRRTTRNPFLLSGLALAGANRRALAGPDEDDGILTGDEIASLDLSGLEWAVLSACDTGVGDIQSGEGVLGLRRAFQSAGAGTLIMSLWAVEDRSARDWMKLLYQARFQGKLETAQAVREATLGVLRSLRKEGRSTHPFYWASFIAAGDWR